MAGAGASAREREIMAGVLLATNSYADGGERAERAWIDFEQYIISRHLTHLRPSVALTAYAGYCVLKGLQLSTILTYLSTIRAYGQKLDPIWCAGPIDQHRYGLLRDNLKRTLRAAATPSDDTRYAVTQSDLQRLVHHANTRYGMEGALLGDVLIIMFGGLLRGQDLLVTGRFAPTSADVAMFPETGYATIRLRKRKTMNSARFPIMEALLCDFMPLDPVRAVQNLQILAASHPGTRLIPATLNMGSSSFPLLLRNLVQECGLPPTLTPHAFRRGRRYLSLRTGGQSGSDHANRWLDHP